MYNGPALPFLKHVYPVLNLRQRPLAFKTVFAPGEVGAAADKDLALKLLFPGGEEGIADIFGHRCVTLHQQRLRLRRERDLPDEALYLYRHALLFCDGSQAAAERAAARQRRPDIRARAFARYLHEAEPRDAVDARLAAVVLEKLLQLMHEGVIVLLVLHIYEIDDDDAAERAQPELSGYLDRGLQVGLEHRIVQVLGTDKFTGVDVDHRQRLGLVYDEVSPRGEPDLAVLKLRYLVFQPIDLEERHLALEEIHVDLLLGEELSDDSLYTLFFLFAVDDDLVYLIGQFVTQHSLERSDVAVDEAGGAVLFGVAPYRLPLREESFDVLAQPVCVAALRDGPDDDPEILRAYILRYGAQPRAFVIVLDTFGDSRLVAAWDEHHVTPRERDTRRDARPLALAGVLDDLHEHVHARPDLHAFDVVKVKEAVAPVSKVQKSGIHSRQDAVDARLIYLARPLMFQHPFDKNFVKLPLLVDYGDPDLFGVNEICYYLL
ncbi:hypothetical protein SDC9_93723 [bioreactor metagenome]|uniref:Uncharacterized protein n=1 Tax=bioreactor metagenome TaxID=1076179 RepID=A0A645A1E1_9ZZZZ